MNDIVIQFDHIKLCLTLRMIGTEPHHQARALNTQHFPFARKKFFYRELSESDKRVVGPCA
jgi:hypothetical protein